MTFIDANLLIGGLVVVMFGYCAIKVWQTLNNWGKK